LTLERALLPALHAIPVVRSHRGLLLAFRSRCDLG
jgi:hypothetical protein